MEHVVAYWVKTMQPEPMHTTHVGCLSVSSDYLFSAIDWLLLTENPK